MGADGVLWTGCWGVVDGEIGGEAGERLLIFPRGLRVITPSSAVSVGLSLNIASRLCRVMQIMTPANLYLMIDLAISLSPASNLSEIKEI